MSRHGPPDAITLVFVSDVADPLAWGILSMAESARLTFASQNLMSLRTLRSPDDDGRNLETRCRSSAPRGQGRAERGAGFRPDDRAVADLRRWRNCISRSMTSARLIDRDDYCV